MYQNNFLLNAGSNVSSTLFGSDSWNWMVGHNSGDVWLTHNAGQSWSFIKRFPATPVLAPHKTSLAHLASVYNDYVYEYVNGEFHPWESLGRQEWTSISNDNDSYVCTDNKIYRKRLVTFPYNIDAMTSGQVGDAFFPWIDVTPPMLSSELIKVSAADEYVLAIGNDCAYFSMTYGDTWTDLKTYAELENVTNFVDCHVHKISTLNIDAIVCLAVRGGYVYFMNTDCMNKHVIRKVINGSAIQRWNNVTVGAGQIYASSGPLYTDDQLQTYDSSIYRTNLSIYNYVDIYREPWQFEFQKFYSNEPSSRIISSSMSHGGRYWLTIMSDGYIYLNGKRIQFFERGVYNSVAIAPGEYWRTFKFQEV